MESIFNWEYISLVPPLLTLLLVILTRKVGLSLGTGIVTSALIIANGNIVETLKLIWEKFAWIFVEDGAINTWNAFILIFLVMLGILIAFMNMSGGARAFTNWALNKFKSRRQAGLAAGLLGIIIFIDDYFSSLVTGQVAKPLTDKYQISRAKLAYIVDTTASPVSVVAPISSWGAGIMGLVAPLLVAAGITSVTPFQALLTIIPMNFYVIAALLMMFIVILTRFDIGPMRKQEERALVDNILTDENKVAKKDEQEDLPVVENSSAKALIVPMVGLAVTVILAMLVTGAMEAGSFDIYGIMENMLVTHSLIAGGIVGLALSFMYYFKFTKKNQSFGSREILVGIKSGFLAMLPAIIVLTLAWMIGELISDLGTGTVLGEMVQQSSLPISMFLGVIFAVACIMAMATGTSWGSFGILIPIAGDIMISIGETELLLPAIAAVISGAVFGDHCSPISDSTVLSSTGAGCNHITHVITQLPYALLSAGIAFFGYIVLGMTNSVILALLVVLALVVVVFVISKFVYKPIGKPVNEEVN
jgi:tetracycline resistance efflux pump